MTFTTLLWLILLVVFLLLEAVTVSLVSLWFAGGCIVAAFASIFGVDLWVQTVLFFVVSFVLLAFLRPISRKYLSPKLQKTNLDAILGSTGLVTLGIDNVYSAGQVKLGAMEWSARSTSGDVIAVGTLVKVDRIEGVKLFVSPVQPPEKV